jgi:GntP family gluconate:H+ symporter
MHAIVPPHPGPVTAATEIGASIGLTLLVGVVVAVVAWFVGVYAVTLAWLGKVYVPIDDSVLTGGREADTDNPPAFWHVLGILLLPLVLIGANTVLTTLRANGTIDEEGGWADVLVFVGQTPVALLIALLVATYTLAVRRYSLGETESLLNDSGFWLVGRFFGMDVKTTLRTWTVMETTLGVSIFVLSLGLWAVG